MGEHAAGRTDHGRGWWTDDYGDNQGGVESASVDCGYALILVRGERTDLDPIWRHPASSSICAADECTLPRRAFIDVDGPPSKTSPPQSLAIPLQRLHVTGRHPSLTHSQSPPADLVFELPATARPRSAKDPAQDIT